MLEKKISTHGLVKKLMTKYIKEGGANLKKAKLSAIISTMITCFIFWIIVTGQIVAVFKGGFSLMIWIAGIVVSFLVALFAARFFIHEKAFYLFNPVRFFIMIFYCIIVFMWELIKANWDVAKRALKPGKLNINPGIVKVPSELKSEYALSMLANSITLTPGTITMDIAEDESGKNWYYIHWIDVATEEPEEAGDEIKGTMEKWIRRIWK